MAALEGAFGARLVPALRLWEADASAGVWRDGLTGEAGASLTPDEAREAAVFEAQGSGLIELGPLPEGWNR